MDERIVKLARGLVNHSMKVKENDKVYIQNSYKIKSVFGNIVNLKNYTVSINYVVINSNNGIIIEDNKGDI